MFAEYSIDSEELEFEESDLESSMNSEDEFVEFSLNEGDHFYIRKSLMLNFETQIRKLIANDNSKISLKELFYLR